MGWKVWGGGRKRKRKTWVFLVSYGKSTTTREEEDASHPKQQLYLDLSLPMAEKIAGILGGFRPGKEGGGGEDQEKLCGRVTG